MGSHVGPILADFFLAKLENRPLKDNIRLSKNLEHEC